MLVKLKHYIKEVRWMIILVLLCYILFAQKSVICDETQITEIICCDETGKVITNGSILFVLKDREPIEVDIQKTSCLNQIDLGKLKYICFNSPQFQTKIIARKDLQIRNQLLQVSEIKRNKTPLQPGIFAPRKNILRIKGKINLKGLETLTISSLNYSSSINTVYIVEDNFTISFDLRSIFLLDLVPNSIFILFRNDQKHIPYVARAEKINENVMSKTYEITKKVELTPYDFAIKSPKTNEKIYGSFINFELEDFSFDYNFGQLRYIIKEVDSVIYSTIPNIEKNTKFVFENAFQLLKRNKEYIFRASYFSNLVGKDIVMKQESFFYASNPPNEFSLIKNNSLKNTYRSNEIFSIFWHPSADLDEEDVIRYNYSIYEKRHPDKILINETTNKTMCNILCDSTIFEDGKKYVFHVMAVDSYNISTPSSNSYTFRYKGPKPKIYFELINQYYPYSVQYQPNIFIKTKEYKKFLSSLQTSKNFENYQQINLVRKDNLLTNQFNLETTISLYSLYGLGLSFQPSWQLTESKSLAFAPFINITRAVFAHGLNDQTNGFWKTNLGFNTGIRLGKGGGVSFSSSWIPYYEIPYQTETEEIKYFKGNGGQIKGQLIFPEELIPEFEIPLINITIDPRRFPIEYKYSKIKDKNVVELKEHSLGIGYLLE